jgi:ABC-type uncharacterized transport system fused permease/ATPase subunit
MLSIGHRSTLLDLHERHIEVRRGTDGPATLAAAPAQLAVAE